MACQVGPAGQTSGKLTHFLFLVALLLGSATIAEDWPRWRGPDLNGVSREKHWSTSWPQEGPKQLWKVSDGKFPKLLWSLLRPGSGPVFFAGNSIEIGPAPAGPILCDCRTSEQQGHKKKKVRQLPGRLAGGSHLACHVNFHRFSSLTVSTWLSAKPAVT